MNKYIITYNTRRQARERINRQQVILAVITLYGGAVILAILETIATVG